ncbi:MAG: hypothetical protein HYU81_00880 [Candidatus Brennerbacteria bacterium]|nr:hypothetical protein [Candidatus Brennerbacteria bacterium]
MTSFKNKLFVEIGIGGGIVIALGIALAMLGGSMKTASGRVVTTRTELLERSASVGSLAALRETWKTRAETSLNVLRNVVPEKDTLINVSRDFQSLASQTRTEYSFGFVGETPAGAAGDIGALNFRLTLRGDLPNIYSFIEKFREFPYFSMIDSFVIERKGSEARSELVANGRIFYR